MHPTLVVDSGKNPERSRTVSRVSAQSLLPPLSRLPELNLSVWLRRKPPTRERRCPLLVSPAGPVAKDRTDALL